MNMQPVHSDTIEMIGYDEQTHRLRVALKHQKARDFCHVPKDVFIAFCNARSKQRFYHRHIVDQYAG